MEKQNRAERRRNKFGGGRATDHGGWPTHQPNPAFAAETPAEPAPGVSGSDPVASADPPPKPAGEPASGAGLDNKASDTAES